MITDHDHTWCAFGGLIGADQLRIGDYPVLGRGGCRRERKMSEIKRAEELRQVAILLRATLEDIETFLEEIGELPQTDTPPPSPGGRQKR